MARSYQCFSCILHVIPAQYSSAQIITVHDRGTVHIQCQTYVHTIGFFLSLVKNKSLFFNRNMKLKFMKKKPGILNTGQFSTETGSFLE